MYNMEIYCTRPYCIGRDACGVESNTGFQYNKTDRHDITEILLKVVLSTVNQLLQITTKFLTRTSKMWAANLKC